MMKPSDKSPGMEKFIKETFGIDRQKHIESNTCVFCKGPAIEFQDDLSRQEYQISGICQKCQNEVWGK